MSSNIASTILRQARSSPFRAASASAMFFFASYVLYHQYRYLKNPLRALPRATNTLWLVFGIVRELLFPKKDHTSDFQVPALIEQIYADPKKRPMAVLWTSPITDSAVVIVNSLPVMREILVKGTAKYSANHKAMRGAYQRSNFGQIFANLSIATATHGEWRWRRAAMIKFFQPRLLVTSLLSYSLERSNQFGDFAAQKHGEPVEITSPIIKVTSDIILQYLFGRVDRLDFSDLEGGAETGIERHYTMMSHGFTSLYHHLPIIGKTEWARPFDSVRRRLETFINKAIDTAFDEYAKNPNLDFVPLAVALATQVPQYAADRNVLIADLIILIFAGHDTTSHSCAFILGEISRHPDVQDKIFAEVRTLLGPPPVDPSNISMESLSSLKYTTACIREAMRIYPVAVGVEALICEDMAVGGYVLPKGAQVVCNILGLNRDPEVFPEPRRFNPERWLSDDDVDTAFADVDKADGVFKGKLTPQNYPDLSFSLGTHACIGRNFAFLEMRMLIAILVNRFHLKHRDADKLAQSNALLPADVILTMRPKDGMWVGFEERK